MKLSSTSCVLLLPLLLLLLAQLFAVHSGYQVCPNQCHSDAQFAYNDCNNFDNEYYAMCRVVGCRGGGFSCSFPENSFLMPYGQFSQLEMVIEYTWSPEQSDLDTSTRLNGAEVINVGYSCGGSSPYVVYGGDSSSDGGSEFVVLDLVTPAGDLYDDSVSIDAYAGWHGSRNQGAARMSVYLRRKSDKVLATGTILSTVISPGNQDGCAATHVASVYYFHGVNNTRITLTRM